MNGAADRLGRASLVAALLAYPFVDHALQAQTVHAVTDGMIYVLLALGLNIVVGYAGLLDLGLRGLLRHRRLHHGPPQLAGARLAALRARVELLGRASGSPPLVSAAARRW